MIGGVQNAQAAIVYWGTPVAVPGNIDGVYVNVVSHASGATGGAVAGWDINPYNGGSNLYSNGTAIGTAYVNTTGATGTIAANLAVGTLISAASNYNSTGAIQSTTTTFTAGVPGIVGFKFKRESDSAVLYGWFRLIRGSATTVAGTIVDYAYEDTGAAIAAGDTGVPAPGALALLAVGALGARGRKRKTA